jgi:glycerol kinase
LDDVAHHWQMERRFDPQMESAERQRFYKKWKKAVERAWGWET